METPSPVSVVLLVCSLIIRKEYSCLVFSSQFGIIVFTLGLWSMGNGSGFILIVTGLLPRIPCSMCCDGLGWKEFTIRVESREMLEKTGGGKSRWYELLSQICIEVVGDRSWITSGLTNIILLPFTTTCLLVFHILNITLRRLLVLVLGIIFVRGQ